MKRFLAVLFWSVLAAAFIGPGTVTTCASSGTSYRYSLLWALTFSTIATVLLQEAAARLTVTSGRNLGQALRESYRGAKGLGVLLLVVGAIIVGCAAYQAGNILGAVEGARLATGLPATALALLWGFLAGALLWVGAPRTVAILLSLTVAVMGICFLVTAVLLRPPVDEVLAGSVVPSFPAGSGLLILGLVGTTVVPYNLFLGSGIAHGQSLPEIRFGISVAVILGGIISMGILVVGAALQGQEFGYEPLGAVLAARLGGWAAQFFDWGLFAAGFSSAITAPLAAAITARGLFEDREGPLRWGDRSWRFRAVWMGVLLFGLGFGVAGVRPIPVIILAQAFNGVLLPLAAIFLLWAVNDRRLMGEAGLNGPISNTLMVGVVLVSLVLGVNNVMRAGAAVLKLKPPDERDLLLVSGVAAVVLLVPVVRGVVRRRNLAGSAALP